MLARKVLSSSQWCHMDGCPSLLDSVHWQERNNQCFEDSKRIVVDLKLFFFRTLSNWMSIVGSHSIFSIYDLMDVCQLCT